MCPIEETSNIGSDGENKNFVNTTDRDRIRRSPEERTPEIKIPPRNLYYNEIHPPSSTPMLNAEASLAHDVLVDRLLDDEQRAKKKENEVDWARITEQGLLKEIDKQVSKTSSRRGSMNEADMIEQTRVLRKEERQMSLGRATAEAFEREARLRLIARRRAFEDEAWQRVQNQEIAEEIERKEDMQSKRRREKAIQIEEAKHKEALARANEAENEEEREKHLREASKAERKATTSQLLQDNVPSKDFRVEPQNYFQTQSEYEKVALARKKAVDDLLNAKYPPRHGNPVFDPADRSPQSQGHGQYADQRSTTPTSLLNHTGLSPGGPLSTPSSSRPASQGSDTAPNHYPEQMVYSNSALRSPDVWTTPDYDSSDVDKFTLDPHPIRKFHPTDGGMTAAQISSAPLTAGDQTNSSNLVHEDNDRGESELDDIRPSIMPDDPSQADLVWSSEWESSHDVDENIESYFTDIRQNVNEAFENHNQDISQSIPLPPWLRPPFIDGGNITFIPTGNSDRMLESIESENDDTSSVYSYSSSIFSKKSTSSTATSLTGSSGYTADEISTATGKVAQAFERNGLWRPLYTRALGDSAIGPARLERNLKRLLRQCAEDLKSEARDPVEFLGARLISHQAGKLADIVVSQYRNSSPEVSSHSRNGKEKNRSSEESREESSDDEEPPEQFEATVFSDTLTFISFLEESKAFHNFQERLEKFINHEQILLRRRGNRTAVEVPEPLHNQLTLSTMPVSIVPDVSIDASHSDLNPTGLSGEKGTQLRPTILQHNQLSTQKESGNSVSESSLKLYKPSTSVVQLRWKCVSRCIDLEDLTDPSKRCDKKFVGNVTELRGDGLSDHVHRMQQYVGSKVTVSQATNTTHTNKAKAIYQQLRSFLSIGFLNLASKLKRQNQRSLPQHNNSPAVASSSLPPVQTPQQHILHLLACKNVSRFRKVLSQDRVESITHDRKLFTFMRDKHARRWRRNGIIPSLIEVKGIFFVKFRLPLGGNVEVRHHNPCCPTSTCECIPPKDLVEPSSQAEYRCIPGPPAVWPPVDPQYLGHLFNEPACINEKDTWILDQLPRRVCGELHGKAGRPAEGWGIYYQEGLNLHVVVLIVAVVFILASVFGVFWAYYKQDIQGAFGVSSYIFAACGVFLSLIVMNAG